MEQLNEEKAALVRQMAEIAEAMKEERQQCKDRIEEAEKAALAQTDTSEAEKRRLEKERDEERQRVADTEEELSRKVSSFGATFPCRQLAFWNSKRKRETTEKNRAQRRRS